MPFILEVLAKHLEEIGQIDLSEFFIDGTFAAKKRGARVGKTKSRKGTKLIVIGEAASPPLAVHTASASPHEVTLIEVTPNEILIVGRPERLIGDRAYDSDPLDQTLIARRVELIAPRRINRQRAATQDGRALRRYRRQRKTECLFCVDEQIQTHDYSL